MGVVTWSVGLLFGVILTVAFWALFAVVALALVADSAHACAGAILPDGTIISAEQSCGPAKPTGVVAKPTEAERHWMEAAGKWKDLYCFDHPKRLACVR
jgi:hypothetical protein